MNYSSIINYDVLNGKGVRTTLFVSGCNHHCKECFNRDTHDFEYGKPFTQDTINELIYNFNTGYVTIDGLSLLGGCPMCNAKELIPFVKQYKEGCPTANIWLWCGEVWEDILKNPLQRELLECIDILVDGTFEYEKADARLSWRGSYNQRVIEVKKSLEEGKIILMEGTENEL